MEARDDFPLARQRKQCSRNSMGLSEEHWMLCPADDDDDGGGCVDDDDDDDDDDELK